MNGAAGLDKVCGPPPVGWGRHMPRGPDAQVLPGYGIPEKPNYMAQIMSQMGQYLPYLMGGAGGVETTPLLSEGYLPEPTPVSLPSPGISPAASMPFAPQATATSPWLSQLEAELNVPTSAGVAWDPYLGRILGGG